MAEELRLALILLGSLAIGSVILHGIWTVRKSAQQNKQDLKPEQPEVDAEEQELSADTSAPLKQMEMNFTALEQESGAEGLPIVDVNVDAIYDNEAVSKSNIEDDHGYRDELNTRHQDMFATADEAESNEPTLGNFSALDDNETDPEASESQNIKTQAKQASAIQQPQSSEKVKETQKQEVLMLFVSKPEGEAICGAKLLPLLLTLGFKFGDMDFFHRHQSSSGQGEVLFSLANMYNPGTFDIDHMEQMTTRGLTIFMTLPNAAEPLQTFNLMHKAAKSIAQEFGAELLDNNRKPIDVATLRGYVERIRKFED